MCLDGKSSFLSEKRKESSDDSKPKSQATSNETDFDSDSNSFSDQSLSKVDQQKAIGIGGSDELSDNRGEEGWCGKVDQQLDNLCSLHVRAR